MISDNPINISNLKIWFDAADKATMGLTSIGSLTASIDSIKDKVNGVVLYKNNVRPTYYYNIINNKNAVYFGVTSVDGFGGYGCLIGTNIPYMASATHSIYFVFQPMSDISSAYTFGNWALCIQNGGRSILAGTYPDIGIYRYVSSTSALDGYLEAVSSYLSSGLRNVYEYNNGTSSTSNLTNLNIISTRLNGTSSVGKFSQMSRDKRPMYFTQSAIGINPGSSASIILGDRQSTPYTLNPSSTPYPYVGYFCEFLFFDRYLSDTEDHQINEYLKKKWIG